MPGLRSKKVGPQLDPRGSMGLDPSNSTTRKISRTVGMTGFEPATYTSRNMTVLGARYGWYQGK